MAVLDPFVVVAAGVVAVCATTATGRIMRKNAAARRRIFRFTLKLRASMKIVGIARSLVTIA